MSAQLDKQSSYVRTSDAEAPNAANAHAVNLKTETGLAQQGLESQNDKMNANTINFLAAMSKAKEEIKGDEYKKLLKKETMYFDAALTMLSTDATAKPELLPIQNEYGFSIEGVNRLAEALRALHVKKVAEKTMADAAAKVPEVKKFWDGTPMKGGAAFV